MDGKNRKILLRDLNAHLICVLCGGYFIDATSISECLHSFCKSCIVKYLETNKFCPICDVQLHKAEPLLSIRPDKTLQRLVYKMVPGLYSIEMQKRRQFYLNTEIESSTDTDVSCDQALALHEQQRSGNIYYSPEDSISLSLEYYISGNKNSEEKADDDSSINKQMPPRRYFQCPAGVKMYLLKKILRTKYNLAPDDKVDIIYADECLPDEFSLMDVAYTFMWNRVTPMRFSYRIFERSTISVPATHMGPTTSPQPTIASDTPDITKNASSHNKTDDDASSKGRQMYSDKRRLRESDSDAETSTFNKSKQEIKNKGRTGPPVKKIRLNSKKANQSLKKKQNSRFKSLDRRKSLQKKKEINRKVEDKISQHLVQIDQPEPEIPLANNIEDEMEVDDSAADITKKEEVPEDETNVEKPVNVSKENTNEQVEIQEDFILQDQQMDNDDLEEDDEDRLRISASEEDVTQEDRTPSEDVREETITEPLLSAPESPKKIKEKEEVEEEDENEGEEEVKIEEKRSEIKKGGEFKVKRRNKKAKHHHHHRHHDRKRDHPPPPAATILHSPDMKNDIMKLKVKITKPGDQSKYYHRYSSHSPTRHHNSKHKTNYVISEESDKPSKSEISNGDEDSGNSRTTDDNEHEVKNNDSNKKSPADILVDEETISTKTVKEKESVSNLNGNENTRNSSLSSSKNSNSCNNNNSNNSNNSTNSSTTNNNNSSSNNNYNNNNSNNTKNNVIEAVFIKNRGNTNSSTSNKEKLLQMRAVRHKNIVNTKEIAAAYITRKVEDDDEDEEEEEEEEYDDVEEIKPTSTILIPPSSITVSKITAAEKQKMEEEKLLMMSGKHNGNGLDSKRPSLEIMLVNAPNSKNNLKSSSSSSLSSTHDEKAAEKYAKLLKRPPPSIPLARTQKAGISSTISGNRHSLQSLAHKINNKQLNRSPSLINKTFTGVSNKDGKPKHRTDEEIKSQEKLTPSALSKARLSGTQDDFGALDLSDKSSRKGSSSASSTSSENSNCPSPNSNIFPGPQNLSQRQYSSLHSSTGSVGRSPSNSPPQVCTSLPKNSPETGHGMFPPSMRNLMTLSDTAAHIRDMMAARDGSKGHLLPPNSIKKSPQRYLSESPPSSKCLSNPRTAMPSSPTQLKIPIPNLPLNSKALGSRGRTGGIPNLNEISPGSGSCLGRGKNSGMGMQNNRALPISKPGPNQTVRHIPNPSVLLFRQQNQLKNMSSAIPPGPSSPGKKLNYNGRGPNMPPPPPAIPLSSLRRMESMTRNIEKVAAGLSVKAAVEAGYGSVK
ncbi:uncharacterized protein LOC142319204 [Lycorma delicatula]|uniref:uncharacterized protein LOC142319204 n=1 Tax=Lycorma delicatula TaxID=130591 RepID=UPI003F50D8EB